MLNISKKLRAAWDSASSKYDLPKAVLIPFGESSNEQKKLSSVLNKYNSIEDYVNTPLPGFTLYKSDRKSWGSLDQSWLVIDPRGFLVRITSQNLEKILHVTGITEGLIQEKCIWAREDTQTKLTLVPISSPSYQEAVKNTELIEGKISIKDVEIGDRVITQGGLEGIFRGTLSLYGSLHETKKELAPQAFLRRQIIEIDDKKFYYQTNAKILKVIKKTDRKITKEESAKYLTEAASKGAIFSSSGYFGTYFSSLGSIQLISVHAVQRPKISYVEIDIKEAEQLLNDSKPTRDSGKLLLETIPNSQYIISFPYYGIASSTVSKDQFDISPVKSNESDEKITLPDVYRTYSTKNKPGTHSLDKFTKFYKIVKHVKNETYV
jgi:hypothetical protein